MVTSKQVTIKFGNKGKVVKMSEKIQHVNPFAKEAPRVIPILLFLATPQTTNSSRAIELLFLLLIKREESCGL